MQLDWIAHYYSRIIEAVFPKRNRMTKKLTARVHIVLLVFAAMALTYPYLTKGLVDGHDRQEHIEYQHYFNQQIEDGEFYPRWVPGLNLGHGSPAFFVLYPLPYYVAWGLGHVIPNHWGIYTETRSQGLGVVLATILGALFTYAWCGTFVDSWTAMAASLMFITLPYFFSIDLYVRTSVGELWALAIMPLAFYFVERRSSQVSRFLAGLAAAFALVLLSHLFTAVLLAPVLMGYAVWRADPAKRLHAALQTAAALTLGIALAAVYTFPFFAHRHFLHPENMLSIFGANYSPLSQMFPYDLSMFPQSTSGWRGLSQIARCLAGAIVCLVGYASYRFRRERLPNLFAVFVAVLSTVALVLTLLAGHLPGLGTVPGALPLGGYFAEQRAHIFLASFLTLEAALLCYWSLPKLPGDGLADLLICIALMSFFMMTRWTAIVWTTIHPLWSIQFPWRFNALLLLATTGLAALAISNLAKAPPAKRVLNGVIAIVVWALIAGGTARMEHVKDMYWRRQPVAYQAKTLDTLLPVYAEVKSEQEAVNTVNSIDQDLVNSAKNARINLTVTSGNGEATATLVNPRLIELTAICRSDCTLQVGQFYYPAWQARLAQDGTPITLRAGKPGGQMELSLPQGENSVIVDLPLDWSERIGPWVSLASLILIAVFALSDGLPTKIGIRD
jgi:hypothetical protein